MKNTNKKTIFDEETELKFAEENKYLLDLLHDGKIRELKESIIKNIDHIIFEYAGCIPSERLVELANFKHRVEIEKRQKAIEVITHHWTEMHRVVLEICILGKLVQEQRRNKTKNH